MSKKLFDFGVVTFDSDYNPDYNRFHVRIEAEINVTSALWPCASSNPTKFVECNKISAEISRNGKRIEYGDCLDTILKHSDLKNNSKFLKLYRMYKNHATLAVEHATELIR